MNKLLSFGFGAVSVIMYFAGTCFIFWSFLGKSYDPFAKLMYGIGIFAFGLILSGFSYIVEAACKYLNERIVPEE